jgi:hypothetical protein
VLKVNEFKTLCSQVSKHANEIKIEAQDNAVKISAGSHKLSYGRWVDGAPVHTCSVKDHPFLRANRINIGNTKNSLAGIYVKDGYPLLFRTKLSVVEFCIYSKKWVE